MARHIIKTSLLLAVCLFVTLEIVNADYCGPWPVLPYEEIKLAQPNDTIHVWYLAAPLMYCSFKDKLTLLNGYHGGVGLENKNTGYSITMNYNAHPSFSEAVFPGIKRWPNGSTTLEWTAGGQTFVYEGMNMTYWHCGSKVVGTMTGEQYNTFLAWFKNINSTYTHYSTLAVYKKFPEEPYLVGFECFEFVFGIIETLVLKFNAKLLPGITKLKAAIGNVYTDDLPIKVSFNDPAHHEEIINYFSMLELQFKELGPVKFFQQLYKLFFKGVCYVYYQGDYYFVKVVFPYFKQHWTDMPLFGPEPINTRFRNLQDSRQNN